MINKNLLILSAIFIQRNAESRNCITCVPRFNVHILHRVRAKVQGDSVFETRSRRILIFQNHGYWLMMSNKTGLRKAGETLISSRFNP